MDDLNDILPGIDMEKENQISEELDAKFEAKIDRLELIQEKLNHARAFLQDLITKITDPKIIYEIKREILRIS